MLYSVVLSVESSDDIRVGDNRNSLVTLNRFGNFYTGSNVEQSSGDAATINVKAFGAIADGASHKISSADITGNAIRWRGTYSVGDEWDYVALQEAIYAAFGGPQNDDTPTGWHRTRYAHLNKPLFIPQGSYVVNKTLELKGVSGFRIQGAMRLSTTITQVSPNKPVLYADGLSYGVIEGISFSAGAANSNALIEIDWTGAVSSLKPQQLTVSDCVFHGQNVAAYGLRIAKSGAIAQGDTVLLNNNLYIGCTEAGLAAGSPSSYAFNALSIMSHGGNVQGCPRYGIVTYAGSVFVHGTSFQNGDNTADFASFSGVHESIPFIGVRSESLRVVLSISVQNFIVDGLEHTPSLQTWNKGGMTTVSAVFGGTDGRAFKVTGVKGAMGEEPSWASVPSGGSTTSGGVTFQQYDFNVIEAMQASIRSSTLFGGRIRIGAPQNPSQISQLIVSRPDWLVPGVADDSSGQSRNLVSISNVLVVHGAAWAVTSGSAGGAPFYSSSQLNLGTQPIIFSRGRLGVPYRDIGIAPGDGYQATGDQTDISRNVVGVIGTLGKISRSGTNAEGEDLNIQGGLGAGAGGGGAIRLRAQAPTASGADVPDAQDKVIIDYRGVSVGGGASISRLLSEVAAWNPPPMASGETVVTEVAVPGAKNGDVVAVGFSSITAGGWQISGQVTANGVVTVTLTNQTGRATDLTSGTLRASVTQY